MFDWSCCAGAQYWKKLVVFSLKLCMLSGWIALARAYNYGIFYLEPLTLLRNNVLIAGLYWIVSNNEYL